MGKDVIIACDFAEKTEVLDFLSAFTDRKPFIKIGMELFYAEGADIVRELKRRGHKIFLDFTIFQTPSKKQCVFCPPLILTCATFMQAARLQ